MSNRKRTKTSKRRTARKMDSMQFVAIGVILAAVVLIAWLAIPKEAGQDDDQGDLFACDPAK